METPPDGSQVSPLAGYDAGGHALAAIEPLEGDGAVLAELARAVEHVSPRRTTRRPPSARTPTIGPTLRRSAAATASRLSRRPRQDPRALSQGPGDPAEPLAGRSCGRDGRAFAPDAAPATCRDREPPRDGRTRNADGTLARASTASPLQPRPRHRHPENEPLLIDQLATILVAMGDDLPAQRDRALLLLGYAGAFRRSELVALDVEQLRFTGAGCYVWIKSAKNDPRKKGRELFVPRLPTTSTKAELCAVAALERWLAIVGPAGPVFRTFDLRGQLTPRGSTRATSHGSFVDGPRRRALPATSRGIRCGAGSSRTPRRRRSRSGVSSEWRGSAAAGSCWSTSRPRRSTTTRLYWRSWVHGDIGSIQLGHWSYSDTTGSGFWMFSRTWKTSTDKSPRFVDSCRTERDQAS